MGKYLHVFLSFVSLSCLTKFQLTNRSDSAIQNLDINLSLGEHL